VAEFDTKKSKEDFMKYLLVIFSILALIGTATAQTTPAPKESGKGKECCADCCCCKK